MDGVAMAMENKVTKLLVICRKCESNLPQRVPTNPEGRNFEVWDTQEPLQMNHLIRKLPHLRILHFPPLTRAQPQRHYLMCLSINALS